jgi:hypothetical protein
MLHTWFVAVVALVSVVAFAAFVAVIAVVADETHFLLYQDHCHL